MTIYLINLFLIILFSILIKDRKKFVLLVSIQLFFVLALRSISLGVDLPNYNQGFNYIKELSLFEMISKLNFLSTADLIYPFDYESGYVILNWIVSHLGMNFHGFLIVCAFINIFSFGYFIYKYSDIPWLSFFILCTFGLYTYFFGIIRQSLALSIFLWSLHFALNNKKIKSLLLFILAFLHHRVIILMLPIYFILKKDSIEKKHVIIALLCSLPFFAVSGFVYSNVIYSIMSYIGKDYSGHAMQLNNLFVLLYLIAIIVLAFLNFKKIDKNKRLIVSIFALIFSIYIEIIGLYNDNFARAVQMYNAFLLIIIPSMIKQYNGQKIILIIKMLIVVLLTLFYIYSLNGSEIVPYEIEQNNIIFETTIN